MTTKQLDIKNRTYYFYNDLINQSNFSINDLKLDKKHGKTLTLVHWYIGYVDKNKLEDWKVNSVNPLYLIINKSFCFVGEKDGVKYLKIDKGNKKLEYSVLSIWNQVFSGIKYHIKKVSHECKEFPERKGFPECKESSECKVNYDNDFDKINLFSNINSCY